MTVMMSDVRTNNYSEDFQPFKHWDASSPGLSVLLLSLERNLHHYFHVYCLVRDKK